MVAGGGTGAVTLTNHAVLLGQGTAAVAFAGPGATSGVPLIAQGASADPVFGTAVVAGGGTGTTSFTAYTPICGGTTSTNPLQSVASTGTSGQVLTSNGAGALPTFQTNTGAFAPNSTINIFDDFLFGTSGTSLGSLNWQNVSTTFVVTATTSNANPGICTNTTISAGNSSIFASGATGNAIVLGGGTISINWVVKLATLSTVTNRYIIHAGLGNSATAGLLTDAVYFSYSDNVNSGNWTGNCRASSVTSTANSAVAAVNNAYVNLGIVINAGATSVSFFINGTEIANSPLSSNIPTVAISPFFDVQRTAGTITTGAILVDLFYMTQTLTTPR